MFITLIFMTLFKYWYITIPAVYVILRIAGAPERQRINEKVNKALHKPY